MLLKETEKRREGEEEDVRNYCMISEWMNEPFMESNIASESYVVTMI